MNTLRIAIVCAAITALSQAQVFRPASVTGAAVSVAAAPSHGGSGDHRPGPAPAVHHASPARHHPVYVTRHSPHHYRGAWIHGGSWYRPHYYYNYGWAPYYAVSAPVYAEGDYVWPSTILGGIAGAIIGHNSGHHAWRGAAIGATAGMLIGSVAETAARRREAVAAEQAWASRPVVEASTPPASAPQNVTIINNYYNQSSPMASANSMFGRQ